MRVNTRGQVAAGVGSDFVSIDGVVVGRGGSPAWLTDDEIVYGRTVNGKEDAVVAHKNGAQPRVVAPGGANEVKAGGGRWARYLADGRTGLTDSTGFSNPQAGLHDVGPDGVLYYKPNRERGIVARYLDGREVVISTSAQPLSVRGVPGGCLWVEGDLKVRTWKLPQPVTPAGLSAYSPRAALIGGEWWLAYGDGLRILAQPFSRPEGYVVADFGNTFDLDCVALNDKLRVAYATTQGEQPSQYGVVDLDLTKPRVALSVGMVIPRIGRPVWLGFFTFTDPDAPLPGNCDLRVPPAAPNGARGDIVLRTADGTPIAQYVAGTKPDGSADEGNIDALECNAAAVTDVPAIGYWAKGQQSGRVPNVPIVGVEAYRLKDESLAEFESRVRKAVARCGRVALICQCYTSNLTLTADLASLPAVYARIAKDCVNVEALLVFSGSGRATGLQDHPEVRPQWDALARGIPSAPKVEDNLNKPILAVTKFTGKITKDGWSFACRDSQNPDIEFEVYTKGGSIFANLKHRGGETHTSKPRPVL